MVCARCLVDAGFTCDLTEHFHPQFEMANAIARGDLEIAGIVSDEVAATIPDEFDSATNWPECAKTINDIRDQSNCGCCWY